jgi:hypothetical protein
MPLFVSLISAKPVISVKKHVDTHEREPLQAFSSNLQVAVVDGKTSDKTQEQSTFGEFRIKTNIANRKLQRRCSIAICARCIVVKFTAICEAIER